MSQQKQPTVNNDNKEPEVYLWCWQDNMDGSYKIYDADISLQIESLQIGESIQISMHQRLYLMVRTSDDHGYQQNLKTNFKRNIWKCNMEQLGEFNKNNHSVFYKDKTFCWCWQNNEGIFIPFKQEINDKIDALKHGDSTMINRSNDKQYKVIRNNEWYGIQQNVKTFFERRLWKADVNKLDEYNDDIKQQQKQQDNKRNNDNYFWCWRDKNGSYVPYHRVLSGYIDNMEIGQCMQQSMNNTNYKIERKDELYGHQTNLNTGFTRNIWKFDIDELNHYNRQIEENILKDQQNNIKDQQKHFMNDSNLNDIDIEIKENTDNSNNNNNNNNNNKQNEDDNKDDDDDMDIDENKNDNPFAMPLNIGIEPILQNITMDEITNWRSGGRYSFSSDGEYIHSAGHIAVIYDNKKDNKFEIAFHERTHKMKRGANRLGWPGGIADKYGESIWSSVLRELKEECMSKTNHIELNEENIHLFHARKTYHKPLHFYALFVIFVNNKSLITGPDKHSEWEMIENHHLGMFKHNGYHNFFSFNIDPINKRYKFDNNEIDKMLWNPSTMRKLAKSIKFNDLHLKK